MNRATYFSYIEEKLNILAVRVNSRGRLNILDLHGHAENFYRELLNELYGWSLANINTKSHNVESIDLIDDGNKIVIQISATNTKKKIEDSLSKYTISRYKNYTFKFVSIANNADNLRRDTFGNPHRIKFTPTDDIIDKNSILNEIDNLEIDRLKKIYELIKKELVAEPDIVKLESNLAAVINILSKENFDTPIEIEINSYEIDRKIEFNKLSYSKKIIYDLKLYIGIVDRIYKEFDSLGVNKSRSVLSTIRHEYIKTECEQLSDDKLFLEIIDKIIDKVKKSPNNRVDTEEELEQCVNILVVDAFIRCKIFNNPANYNYAST
jgi:hypothetical protein